MKIGKLRYCIGGLVGLPMVLAAQNPIVQTMYTADPAPMVYDGKLFLYTSHDEDASTWFVMNEWKLYSTTDMVTALMVRSTIRWASRWLRANGETSTQRSSSTTTGRLICIGGIRSVIM